jgi:hypothetical protein
MVLLDQGTVFTTCIFQNAVQEINTRECDLLFSYDGHDIDLLYDNEKIRHKPLKILDIYVNIIIPMANNFSEVINHHKLDTGFNNPYILENGVLIEWTITKGGHTNNSEFVCTFDLGITGLKVGFKLKLQFIEDDDPYYIYLLFLRMLSSSQKFDKFIKKSINEDLQTLIKKYRKIRRGFKLRGNRAITTHQAISEITNIKAQVNIVMQEALNSPSNNEKQAKLLDLRNKLMRLRSVVNFESKEISKIVEDKESFVHVLLSTTIFNRRFVARDHKNNFLDDWYL